MQGFLPEPIGPTDWRAVRLLLPDAVHYGCGCRIAVVRDAEGRVIGAVAISPNTRATPHPGRALALHVIQPWRKQGVGRVLLGWAEGELRSEKLAAAYAWSAVEPGSEEARAWKALGFDRSLDHAVSRMDVETAHRVGTDLMKRLTVRHPLPPNARVAGLREADPEQVVALQTAHLGGVPGVLRPRLAGWTLDALDEELSRVLLVDQR